VDQLVDLSVHVLHARIRQHDGSGVKARRPDWRRAARSRCSPVRMCRRLATPRCVAKSCRSRHGDKRGSRRAGGSLRCRCATSRRLASFEGPPSVSRDARGAGVGASRSAVRGGTRLRARPRPCRAAVPGRRACRSGRAGTRARSTMSSIAPDFSWGQSMGDVCRQDD
jgi:hypothetical protein